ncbi:MAG: flavin reductase family protein [Nitrososphaerota archaeon]|nr:flavin reductase family protein [Nitrososphaerota archaeon]
MPSGRNADGGRLSGPTSKPKLPVDLRNVMRYFASGVTVVTSALDTGEPFGLTVTAFTSVSLDPPLVLVCIRNESSAASLLKKSRRYCVNILSSGQKDISDRFSLAGESRRFDGLEYRVGRVGNPIIGGCIGHIDCKVVRVTVLGDHTVFVGEALDIQAARAEPLLYLDRKYALLAPGGHPG